MATRFWPNENPIGQRIKSEDPPDAVSPWLNIIGIVGNIPQVGMDWDAIPAVYVSDQQVGLARMYLLIKARGEPLDALPSVRQALAELHPDSPLYQIRPQEILHTVSPGFRSFRGRIFRQVEGVELGAVAGGQDNAGNPVAGHGVKGLGKLLFVQRKAFPNLNGRGPVVKSND